MPYVSLLWWRPEGGISVPKHVAVDVCHKWCITEYICRMIYWLQGRNISNWDMPWLIGVFVQSHERWLRWHHAASFHGLWPLFFKHVLNERGFVFPPSPPQGDSLKDGCFLCQAKYLLRLSETQEKELVCRWMCWYISRAYCRSLLWSDVLAFFSLTDDIDNIRD